MDIYDEEIKRLKENPENITSSWMSAEPLFVIIGEISNYDDVYNKLPGCLTQIRRAYIHGAFINGKYNPELTMQIRNDEGIPKFGKAITSKHLERFAYWQRIINSMKD